MQDARYRMLKEPKTSEYKMNRYIKNRDKNLELGTHHERHNKRGFAIMKQNGKVSI